MKKFLFLLVTLSCVFLLIACGNENNDTKKDSKIESNDAKKAENTNESKNKEDDTKSGYLNGKDYNVTWNEDWVGLKTTIINVQIRNTTKEKMQELISEEGEGVIAVKFNLDNTNGQHDINTYPDQATLLTSDGQQLECSMYLSDDLGGELLKGAKKEGNAMFIVPKMADSADVTNIRLKWSANYDTDNWQEDSHKDYDVTIELK